MSEVARHLPLSQHETGDQSAVSSDWRPAIGMTLGLVTDLLESLAPEQWERESLCAGWRVRDVAGHLVWRMGSSLSSIVRDSARVVFREGVSPMRIIDVLSLRAAEAEPRELVRQLREIADARLGLHGRRSVHELSEVVVHGYDIAHALGRTLAIPSVTTGAVALSRALTAPMAIKAAIRDRTLVATDAKWSIGQGPELTASAEALILFLFRRSDEVPPAPGAPDAS